MEGNNYILSLDIEPTISDQAIQNLIAKLGEAGEAAADASGKSFTKNLEEINKSLIKDLGNSKSSQKTLEILNNIKLISSELKKIDAAYEMDFSFSGKSIKSLEALETEIAGFQKRLEGTATQLQETIGKIGSANFNKAYNQLKKNVESSYETLERDISTKNLEKFLNSVKEIMAVNGGKNGLIKAIEPPKQLNSLLKNDSLLGQLNTSRDEIQKEIKDFQKSQKSIQGVQGRFAKSLQSGSATSRFKVTNMSDLFGGITVDEVDKMTDKIRELQAELNKIDKELSSSSDLNSDEVYNKALKAKEIMLQINHLNQRTGGNNYAKLNRFGAEQLEEAIYNSYNNSYDMEISDELEESIARYKELATDSSDVEVLKERLNLLNKIGELIQHNNLLMASQDTFDNLDETNENKFKPNKKLDEDRRNSLYSSYTSNTGEIYSFSDILADRQKVISALHEMNVEVSNVEGSANASAGALELMMTQSVRDASYTTTQVQKLTEELEAAIAKNKELEKENAKLSASQKKAEDDKSYEAKYKEIFKKNAEYENKISELEASVSELKSQLSSGNAVGTDETVVNELQTTVEQLTKELDTVKSEYERYVKWYEETCRENSSLSEENYELNNKLEQYKGIDRGDYAPKVINGMGGTVNQNSYDRLIKDWEECFDKAAKLETELEKLQTALKNTEDELNSYKAKAANVSSSVSKQGATDEQPGISETTPELYKETEAYKTLSQAVQTYNELTSQKLEKNDYDARIKRLQDMQNLVTQIISIVENYDGKANELSELSLISKNGNIGINDISKLEELMNKLKVGEAKNIDKKNQVAQLKQDVQKYEKIINEYSDKFQSIVSQKVTSGKQFNLMKQNLRDLSNSIDQIMEKYNTFKGQDFYSSDFANSGEEFRGRVKDAYLDMDEITKYKGYEEEVLKIQLKYSESLQKQKQEQDAVAEATHKKTEEEKKATEAITQTNAAQIFVAERSREEQKRKAMERQAAKDNNQLSANSQLPAFSNQSQQEIDAINTIDTAVQGLTQHIEDKTIAIKEEVAAMQKAAEQEVNAVQTIDVAIQGLTQHIDDKTIAIDKNVPTNTSQAEDNTVVVQMKPADNVISELRAEIENTLNNQEIELNNIKIGQTTPLITSITNAIQEALNSVTLTVKSENVKLSKEIEINQVKLGEEFTGKLREEISNAIKSSGIKSISVKLDIPENDVLSPKMDQMTELVKQFGTLKDNVKTYQDAINAISKDLPNVLKINSDAVKKISDECNRSLRAINSVTNVLPQDTKDASREQKKRDDKLFNKQISKLQDMRNNLLTGDSNITDSDRIKDTIDEIDVLIKKWNDAKNSKQPLSISEGLDLGNKQQEITKRISLLAKYEQTQKDILSQNDKLEDMKLNANVSGTTLSDLEKLSDDFSDLFSMSPNNNNDIEQWLNNVESAFKRFEQLKEKANSDKNFTNNMATAGRIDLNDPEKAANNYLEAYNKAMDRYANSNNYNSGISEYLKNQYSEILTIIDEVYNKQRELNEATNSDINSRISALNNDVSRFINFDSNKAEEELNNKINSLSRSRTDLIARGFQDNGIITEIDAAISQAGTLRNTLSDIRANNITPQDINTFFTDMTNLEGNARRLSGEIGSMKFSDNITASTSNINAKFEDLLFKISQFREKNSKIKSDSKLNAQFDQLVNSINLSDHTVTAWKEYTKQFNELKNLATSKGAMGRSLGDELSYIAEKIGLKAVIGNGVYNMVNYLRQMVTIVKDINTQMTVLKRVTDETSSAYNKFLSSASKKAGDLGTSISDLVKATGEFAKLGYSLEDATALGESAAIYANVGFMDISQAISSMSSVIQAFNINAQESMNIVDKMNEIGNRYAIDSAGVGDALQRSASALVASGNTLDEAIAMITAGNTIVQDPDSVANGLKTISLRIRGAKTELESLGEETDTMAESTSKLRDKIKAMSGVDIMLNDSTFKSTYQILSEISQVYDKLSDIDRTALIELMAGKNRSNILAAILQNPDVLKNAYNTSTNSEGSAQKELNTYLDSIEGRLTKLKSNFEKLSSDIISEDAVKTIISLGDAIVSVTDSVITLGEKFAAILPGDNWKNYFNDVKALPSIIAAISAAVSIKTKGEANGLSGI